MPSIDDTIESLQKRLEQAKARKREKEAAARAAQVKAERKADTRRKLLVGAMYLDVAQQDLAFQAQHQARLDAFLKRPADRALFGLAEAGQ